MRPISQVQEQAPAARAVTRAPHVAAFLIFAGAAAVTLYFNHSMAGGMRMPGNWTMSMMWMPMGSGIASAALFIMMWLPMMVAMMLPSTLPMLLLYRRSAARRGESHPGRTMFAVGSGYFLVWTIFGAMIYAIGVTVARGAMHSESLSRAVPLAGGLGLCVAGIYQLTPWKSACLKRCREPATAAGHLERGWLGPLDMPGAFRSGVHHGTFCVACCWALMLIQLVLGVMNLAAMVAVAVVIALEKLFSRGELLARVAGLAALAGGMVTAVTSVLSL